MSDTKTHHVTLERAGGYRFVATFPELPKGNQILLDEPAPLGGAEGPNAAALLGAAAGNCLAASLLFCLQKSRAEVGGLQVEVAVDVTRNEEGRFRISGIDVKLLPEVSDQDAARMARCQELYEDFCMVTQSIRQGIPVTVTVEERTVAKSEG
jgi:uncharacterized OsmC-like protein